MKVTIQMKVKVIVNSSKASIIFIMDPVMSVLQYANAGLLMQLLLAEEQAEQPKVLGITMF